MTATLHAPPLASGELARFQDAFAEALRACAADVPGTTELASLVGQRGFAIYRNTVMKGCIDALEANYPAVVRLAGDAWFRAAAAVYAREYTPQHPALLDYGERFADFLATFGPAAELPYLPDVARLDRRWTEAHGAADERSLDAGDFASLPLDDPARIVLVPHASARWSWFADAPIFTLWSRNRAQGRYDDSPLEWRGEGALLVRPRDAVRAHVFGAEGCALLDACVGGGSTADAATAFLAANPDGDFGACLARLVDVGAFARARIIGGAASQVAP